MKLVFSGCSYVVFINVFACHLFIFVCVIVVHPDCHLFSGMNTDMCICLQRMVVWCVYAWSKPTKLLEAAGSVYLLISLLLTHLLQTKCNRS